MENTKQELEIQEITHISHLSRQIALLEGRMGSMENRMERLESGMQSKIENISNRLDTGFKVLELIAGCFLAMTGVCVALMLYCLGVF